jgi:hypothetical protein
VNASLTGVTGAALVLSGSVVAPRARFAICLAGFDVYEWCGRLNGSRLLRVADAREGLSL